MIMNIYFVIIMVMVIIMSIYLLIMMIKFKDWDDWTRYNWVFSVWIDEGRITRVHYDFAKNVLTWYFDHVIVITKY